MFLMACVPEMAPAKGVAFFCLSVPCPRKPAAETDFGGGRVLFECFWTRQSDCLPEPCCETVAAVRQKRFVDVSALLNNLREPIITKLLFPASTESCVATEGFLGNREFLWVLGFISSQLSSLTPTPFPSSSSKGCRLKEGPGSLPARFSKIH